MALGIGSLNIDRLDPRNDAAIPILATEVEVEERVGLDGAGSRPIGDRGKPVVWSTITDLSSEANAKTHREALLALQGTTISTEDIWTDTETNVLVELVSEPIQKLILASGVDKWRVTADVTLRKVAA